MSPAIRRALLCLAATALAAYAAGGVLLWHFPDRFVHFPEPEVRQNPGMAGLRYVDVWLRAGPNREWVHGWFVPNERHAPVVLLLHGTGRTIAGMVHVAAAIHAAGAAVLMIDYRGLGKSSRGPLTEARMYEDAEAAWHELRWHQPDPALRLVYGHSLGGAIALELAARYPDVNGVVVEAAPTSVAALLRGSWVARLYPVEPLLAGRFDAAAKVRRVGAPLLVIHGKRDPIVPAAMGAELYLRATGQKRLLLVESAAHSDAAVVGAAEYQAAFERMLPALREPALAARPPAAAGFAVLRQDSPRSRNRDERVFADPDRLDFDRDAAGHLTFGYGIHQCLGQTLARYELQVIYPALLHRLPGLRLAAPLEGIRFKDDMQIYGVHNLPVAWDGAA